MYVTNNILYDTGEYDYYFTANSSTGNLIRIPENNVLNFETIPSTYTYIPKYSFGTNNGDGKDWQIWAFSGSNVYDWSDTYANGYLKEQFKIQTTSPGLWCGQCLQRGIFNHDPQKGFESADVKISSLENTRREIKIILFIMLFCNGILPVIHILFLMPESLMQQAIPILPM